MAAEEIAREEITYRVSASAWFELGNNGNSLQPFGNADALMCALSNGCENILYRV